MANLFRKVVAMECTGEMDPQCPRLLNKERLKVYKNRCDCGSKAKEITELDATKIAVAGAMALAMLGGGSLIVSPSWGRNTTHVREPIPHPPQTPQAPAPAPAPTQTPEKARIVEAVNQITWSVTTSRNNVHTLLASGDFNREGTTYTATQPLTKGDRVRIQVSFEGKKLYALYRGNNEARTLAARIGGLATLPAGDTWFELDGITGTEEFVLVAANSTLPDLEPSAGLSDPAVLDRILGRLGSGAGSVHIRIPHL